MSNLMKKSWMDRVYFKIWNPSVLLFIAALLLGLVQSWTNRFYMGNDGVSYLDMSDAYLHGDWHTALNGSWNPLYAWLVGIGFLIFRPSPYWEYPVVQLLNFAVYVITLASFEYFLRGWLRLHRGLGNDVAVRVIAYGLFLWSSLILIGVWTANADMLVAASLYATLGLLIRVHKAETVSALTPVFLGVTLAAGYYSKAVMFPISFILLMIAWVLLPWRRALTATVVFVLLAAPLIAGLSKTTGHFTFGDTGRVNYAWYVDGIPFRYWQGGPARAGNPLHPPRIELDSPRVYGFEGAFPQATYPLWYDFAYWYQGIRTWFPPRREAGVIRSNVEWTLELLVKEGAGFLLGWGICFLLSKRKAEFLKNVADLWPAWVTSITAILLYCSVHIEARYIGTFAVLLMLTAFSAIGIGRKRLAAGITLVGLLCAISFAAGPTAGAHYLPWGNRSSNDWWQVASGLQEMGLHPDDKVASVCYSNRANVLWARLARAHIVAETDWDVDFWRLSESDQRRVLDTLAQSGALLAVSDVPPPDPARAVGWLRVGDTKYYAHSLSTAVTARRE
jgi:hypothetical protein